jgi:hypothetical protein
MNTFLMDPQSWAEHELGGCELQDARRTRRLVQVAGRLAQQPNGTLPPSFDAWKELRAAYRLWQRREVSRERILQPHCRGTAAACRRPGCYLLVEDTTELNYTSHPATQGLGRIGEEGGQGLLLHNTLALEVAAWSANRPEVNVVGLAAQHCWTRPQELVRGPVPAGKERKRRRLTRPRESERWASCLEGQAVVPPGVQWLYVADRESDIYEVFQRCAGVRSGFVIRANQPRALAEAGGSVFSAVAQAAVRSRYAVSVPARKDSPARRARVAVRATMVRLRGPWRPGGAPGPQTVNVVEVREEHPPPGAEPVHWVLLTTLPVVTVKQIKQVIGIYTCRWTIEEYHKALKSGTKIEASQLTQAHELEALLGVLSLVALRLLSTKLLARAQPGAAVREDQFGPEGQAILAAKWGRPPGGWTQRELWRAIGRLGGFIGRKSDGEPGWQSIWRGWHRLMILIEGAELHE